MRPREILPRYAGRFFDVLGLKLSMLNSALIQDFFSQPWRL